MDLAAGQHPQFLRVLSQCLHGPYPLGESGSQPDPGRFSRRRFCLPIQARGLQQVGDTDVFGNSPNAAVNGAVLSPGKAPAPATRTSSSAPQPSTRPKRASRARSRVPAFQRLLAIDDLETLSVSVGWGILRRKRHPGAVSVRNDTAQRSALQPASWKDLLSRTAQLSQPPRTSLRHGPRMNHPL